VYADLAGREAPDAPQAITRHPTRLRKISGVEQLSIAATASARLAAAAATAGGRIPAVAPEEIVLTRNASEVNNRVSSGLDLKAGDEVIIFADNHPSNNAAWTQKAKRFEYTVTTLAQPTPHPGPDYYINAVTKAITARTRVLAFTHHTSTVGDVLPARELCRIARERGLLTLLDGACTFGMVDLWPIGEKAQAGVQHLRAVASVPCSAPSPPACTSR
jgi:selenocysteine lyase/cysteine desulfurase